MDFNSDCDGSDGDLYSTGVDLMQKLTKVMERIKRRQMSPRRIPEEQSQAVGAWGRDNGRPVLASADVCSCCQGGCSNASNTDLGAGGVLCRNCAVRMEPSELHLVIRMDPWVSETGQMLIQPSIVSEAATGVEDTRGRGRPGANGRANSAAGESEQGDQWSPVADFLPVELNASRTAGGDSGARTSCGSGGKLKRSQPGIIHGQQQLMQQVVFGSASGDMKHQPLPPPPPQQQQQQPQQPQTQPKSLGAISGSFKGKSRSSGQPQLQLQPPLPPLPPQPLLQPQPQQRGKQQKTNNQQDDDSDDSPGNSGVSGEEDSSSGDNLASPSCASGASSDRQRRHRSRPNLPPPPPPPVLLPPSKDFRQQKFQQQSARGCARGCGNK